MTNELIIESFDKNDPYEVALERQIRDIEGSNDLWSKDKEFPKNVRRASMLCNDAEIEGLTYALYKYRIAKANGFRMRADPHDVLVNAATSAQNLERERWEHAMAHSHSTFQKKINYYKKMIGKLMSKLSKRKRTAKMHHNLHEMIRGEIGADKFVKLLRQAEEVTDWELAVDRWDPPAENCGVCGHPYEVHGDSLDSNGRQTCKLCPWDLCKFGFRQDKDGE